MSEIHADAVSLIDNRPYTTSLAIAEHFDKRHDAVLRDIRALIGDCPSSFTAHNFVASEYTDPTGRKLPMYHVFFDGFILLVMGYTGKKALQMKLAYIEAFNAMKAKLEASKESVAPELDAIFRALIDAKVAEADCSGSIKRVLHAQAWNAYRRHFGLGKNDQLPPARMSEAIAFLARLELGGKKKLERGDRERPERIEAPNSDRRRKSIIDDLDRIEKELKSMEPRVRWQLCPTSADTHDMDFFYTQLHLNNMAVGAIFTAR